MILPSVYFTRRDRKKQLLFGNIRGHYGIVIWFAEKLLFFTEGAVVKNLGDASRPC